MKKIGRYEISGRLGRGGMGVVYKALQPVTGALVALKACQPREEMEMLMGMEAIREAFLREAVSMSRIRHPNVARVWDVDHSRGMPFFTMEFYCNNLGVVLGETYEEDPCRPLAIEESLDYAAQTLAALERLHGQGIVHRDVKPYNLMLSDEDTVKLIDFGLSKSRGETVAGSKGLMVGTPFYSAPEQERDPEGVDGRADLYSVGVILFRCLTGAMPEGPNPGLSELRPELPAQWNSFFAKALAPDPEDRFQDAASMIHEILSMARDWQRIKDEVCVMVEDPAPAPALETPPRSEPRTMGLDDARRAKGLDELWRPAKYLENDFQVQGQVVRDKASGLMWQRSGSPYPASHQEAQEYVEELNSEALSGFSDWRMPTMDELSTLLNPAASQDGLCLADVFDPEIKRVWSADQESDRAAWYVDARQGFAAFQDKSCFFHARAVRTADWETQ